MSLNLLSAMSANTEKYDPRNHLGYRNFRNRRYGHATKGQWNRERTPEEGPLGRERTLPEGSREEAPEEKSVSEKRYRAYVKQQAKTREDAKTNPNSDVAGPSKAEMNNNSFQGDVSSVCVNYVL